MAQNASKLLYNTLYSRGSLSHGPVLLYSYTQLYSARVYSRAIHYTAYTLYSPIRRSSARNTVR